MRKTEREIKDQSLIQKILSNGIIWSVAFFDKEYPYMVPLNYGYK